MSTRNANSKFTEDWLPVRNITNGMIELDNKMKVTGVKIRPRNIFILDSASRNSIISKKLLVKILKKLMILCITM